MDNYINKADSVFNCMDDLFSRVCIGEIEIILADNLKADIGNDKYSGKHSALETNHQVAITAHILKFLRSLPSELSSISLNDSEHLKSIQNEFDRFDYEHSDSIIMSGLKSWIYQDDDLLNACIEYAFEISSAYNQALSLLKICWTYYSDKKGGAVC